MKSAASIEFGKSWNVSGPSFGMDAMSFVFAIAMHVPLFFMKFDANKKSVDRPTERLVSVDLLEEIKPKEPEVAPAPPPVAKVSFMDKIKQLVKKEPPPPAPEIKPIQQKLLEAPKPLPLQAKLEMPEKIQPALSSKTGFQTQADPKLIQDTKLAMNTGVPGIAPLSAKKLGEMDDRSAVKTNKGSFQVGKGDTLKSIGGGPGLSVGGEPVVAIQTGNKGSTEKFSAPMIQKSDKGRIGAISTPNMGGPQLGLRDSIIARDAAANQINVGGKAGGVSGGIPMAAAKRDAGKFQGGVPGGVVGGTGLGAVSPAAPAIAAVPKRAEKKSMFTITGPLKDRRIVKQTTPEYPAWAQAQGITASVVLEFTVEPDGSVKNLIVVRRTSGYPKLDETAIEALRQWKFAPLPDGENRDEVGLITFNYSLS